MHPLLIAALLALLMLANGTPVIARKVLGNRLAYPLDAGLRLADGRMVFGRSKTWRGILLAVIVTTLSAPLLGMSHAIGALVAATSMIGDLLSSFVKRRLGLEPSAMSIGLDQIPESLLPALACRAVLPFSLVDILLVVIIFLVGELALSRLLYAMKIRERPY
jgi:CDP-2,3-bis-(O-geranylgeranyl)-sn-glycerol synthase